MDLTSSQTDTYLQSQLPLPLASGGFGNMPLMAPQPWLGLAPPEQQQMYPDFRYHLGDPSYLGGMAADLQPQPGLLLPDELSARMHSLTLETAARGGLQVPSRMDHPAAAGVQGPLPRRGPGPMHGHGHQMPRPPYLGSGGGVGPAPRRAPMEINHNKAITKKLASAVHYQQVLDVVAESVNVFDEVNVATALHRLAKLQPHNPGAQPSPVIYADHFQQLVLAIKRQLHRFEAQAVSNTLWAFATLAYYPDDEVLDRLADHAATIIHTFRPQATSNTLWAFAKLAYTPCKALLEAAAQQIVCDLGKSVPQDISNTIWAYATLRHHPGQELMKGAAHQAAILMPRFKPQEIANTLWSYATLGHDPGSSLLDSIAQQMSDRIQHFRPQAVSNSLWAYAKLGYNPGSRLLDVTAHRATSMLHQYTSQEIANTLWALSTLEHHPGSRLLDAAAVQIARRVEQFSPQDTTNSMYGFAKLFHHPCNNLPGIVALYALRHWHRFKGSELANLLWSLALLKAVPLDTWQALLTKLAQTPLENFDNADLHQLYQTYLLLDSASEACEHMGVQPLTRGFTDEMVEAIKGAWRLGVQRDGQLATLHEEVSRVLWRMGVVHRNQHILFDGMVCVDIVLEGDTIVLEVDEASHFAVNTWRPLGRTIARRCMLEAWGLVVRSIPFYEWSALQGLEQQKAYLGRLLTSVAVLTPALGSPAPSSTQSV